MATQIKQIKAKDASGSDVLIDAAITNIYRNSKDNLCIETSSDLGGQHVNIESVTGKDIKLKPGDDIELSSSHREADKQDEISIKAIDGSDVPVKLQINASKLTLTSKLKNGNAPSDDFDINVTKGKDAKGYLKVRARAIDLRCEEHGGIALQPKGTDSDGHMNKIKFEHGGGDGLEFGTFNTEKTSIFTDEYRFNSSGKWYPATRQVQPSDKADASDSTTAYKYQKLSDDFYDVINPNYYATTGDIVKTARAFSESTLDINTETSSKGKVTKNIETLSYFDVENGLDFSGALDADYVLDGDFTKKFTENADYDASEYIDSGVPFSKIASLLSKNESLGQSAVLQLMSMEVGASIYVDYSFLNSGSLAFKHGLKITKKSQSPCITLRSDADLQLVGSKSVTLKSKYGKVVLDGDITWPDKIEFGEVENGFHVTNRKLTKKGNDKQCDMLYVVAQNNSTSDKAFAEGSYETKFDSSTTIPAGETAIVGQCSISDIVKLVSYMKNNNQGPWAN